MVVWYLEMGCGTWSGSLFVSRNYRREACLKGMDGWTDERMNGGYE